MTRLTNHLVDMGSLSVQFLRMAAVGPLEIFSVAELDIVKHEFLERVGQSFHDLPYDPYDVAIKSESIMRLNHPGIYARWEMDWLKFWNTLSSSDFLAGAEFWLEKVDTESTKNQLSKIRPHRRRSAFEFFVHSSNCRKKWTIIERGVPIFTQSVDDVRTRPRNFSAPPMPIVRDQDLHKLIAYASLMASSSCPASNTMLVTMHQMLTYASEIKGSKPAPEGRHQDGADFIVSALVIERCNVAGGTSLVFRDGKENIRLAHHQLEPGQGLFQADMSLGLWHDVTPIHAVDPLLPAYRSIVGFDINLAGIE